MARKAGGVENPPALQDGRDCPSMGTIFPPPLKKLKCPWQAALLFRDAPGFFRYAERCRVEPGVLEACFRPAIGKRCATSKPQALASGFVSAFVLFAVEKQAQYYGVDTLFVLVEFFTKLRLRGPTVPGVARWALKVYEEILSLVLPLYRPAVAAVTSRDRSAVPKPVKQAPMLDFQLILDLERLAVNDGMPMGMRFCASAYMLMVFAPLRFSDFKAVFELWTSDTAICGRSIDSKLKRRPIITRSTPLVGIESKGKRVAPYSRFGPPQ